MSNRKFERPRHGHLGFVPRKRCSRSKAKIQCFPADNPEEKPHFTAFPGYKAGMTHVLREVERPGSRLNKKEIVDCVSVIETPCVVVVGVVGYKRGVKGLNTVTNVWAKHVSEDFKRRFSKCYFRSKKNQFMNVAVKDSAPGLAALADCEVIRAVVHTQPRLIPTLKQKKAHVLEVQVNGGTTAEKLEFVTSQFENEISVSSVFEEFECVDALSISKGKGNQGVISRWGVNRLPRKTHRGLRKVACIGSWHPARCSWTVPRAGQDGYYQRTEMSKRIFRIGKKDDPRSGSTASDITEKSITPVGGFPHYGVIRNDFILLKGPVIGPRKRYLCLRKPLLPPSTRIAQEPITIKFIDTSSKIGTGKFQTSEEKRAFYGPLKKDRKAAAAAAAQEA